MKDILNNIKYIRKWSEDTINISIHYVIFIITLFLVWQPKYIQMLDVESWIPSKFQTIVLSLVNDLYNNSLKVIAILFILIVIISLVTNYTSFFERILPGPINYVDGTVVKWNAYSTINRLGRIIISLLTTFWIYYFLINVLLNKYGFSENFFNVNVNDLFQNELILQGYMTAKQLEWMNGLFVLNVAILLYLVIRAFFQIRIPDFTSFINTHDLHSKYVILNKNESEDKAIEIMIVKELYIKKPKFYLISEEQKEYNNLEKKDFLNRSKNPIYKVLNKSEDLEEIKYHFEYVKSK